jgi:hypothetical protein
VTCTRGARALLLAAAPLLACIDAQKTGDFALCCTCLAQKSPQNDGNAIDDTTNCLPDADPDDPSALAEEDRCNEQSVDIIADANSETQIDVVDELCHTVTCLEECVAAGRGGAEFNVREESLSQ